jgi:hypothetical protein
METPAEVHRYAYWSLLGAPGRISIELVILFLKFYLLKIHFLENNL